MSEEKILLEGNKPDSTAAAGAAPAEHPAAPSESVFQVLSKRFRGLFSDDDEPPPEPPEGEEKILLEGNRASRNAAAGAAAAEQPVTPFDAHSKRGLSSDPAGAAAASQSVAPSDAHSKKPSSSSSPSPLEQKVIDEALKKCFDPEIPVNIWELGLIYSVDVSPGGVANVKMTLTAPACPVAGSLPGEVEQKIKAVPGISDAAVELVWEPPWTPEMMTRVAKLMLGM